MTSKRYIKLLDTLHIPLWLIKDISWLMFWKPVGIFMIFPTVFVALLLCIATRHVTDKLMLNFSILCWIVANSNWMLGEFFELNFRPLSFVFFSIGIVTMTIYFILFGKQKFGSE
ncbi:MAG: hypothetical protein ACK4IK_05495 [Bacteroidia bacterium]